MNVTLYNPSSISVDIGQINLDAFHDGVKVGTGFIPSLSVASGLNHISFIGSISLDDLEGDDLEKVVGMFNFYLTGNPIVVSARVSENSGLSSPLLESALESWKLLAAIPGSESSLVESISFYEFDISPAEDDKVQFGASVGIVLDSPLGGDVSLDIQQVKMDIFLKNENGGTIFSSSIPFTPANVVPGATKPTAQLRFSTLLSFSPQEEINFADFVHSFVNNEKVIIVFSGVVDGEVIVGPLGRLLLKGINVNIESSILGMNALSDNQVLEFDLTRSTQETILVDLDIEVVNPSIATVTLGDLSFDVVYDDQVVGFISTNNVTFFPSTNRLDLQGTLDVDENDSKVMAAINTLFSDFVAEEPLAVTARVREDSLNHHILNQGFQGFSMSTSLQEPLSLVSGIVLDLSQLSPLDSSRLTMSASALILVESPFGPEGKLEIQTISLTSAKLYTSQGLFIGTFDSITSILLSANQTKPMSKPLLMQPLP